MACDRASGDPANQPDECASFEGFATRAWRRRRDGGAQPSNVRPRPCFASSIGGVRHRRNATRPLPARRTVSRAGERPTWRGRQIFVGMTPLMQME
jgi:hypothetical protein